MQRVVTVEVFFDSKPVTHTISLKISHLLDISLGKLFETQIHVLCEMLHSADKILQIHCLLVWSVYRVIENIVIIGIVQCHIK